jgi:hypothetical protein
MILLVCLAAMGANRAQCFKQVETQMDQPPIMTVGQQGGMILPVGLGIGATQLTCDVMSPSLAAGMFSIITVAEPFAIIPGPPGTQPGSVHILV